MAGMARTPDGPSARTEYVPVRLTKSQAAHLDESRGAISRSEYIRRLIVRDGNTYTGSETSYDRADPQPF